MKSRRAEILRYRDGHPGVGVREAARAIGVDPGTVSRAFASAPVIATPVAVHDNTATPIATPVAEIPDGWATASIRTDVLDRLQERPALDAALAVLRVAAKTGELDRDTLAELVTIRLSLKPGDKVMWDAGGLFREQATERQRRSVQHRAG